MLWFEREITFSMFVGLDFWGLEFTRGKILIPLFSYFPPPSMASTTPLSPSLYQLPLHLPIQDSLASRFSSVHGARVSIAAETRRVPNFTYVSPLLLPRDAAFNSPLTTHLFCLSSPNGSSPLCQPRPAIILPGLGNNSGDYLDLQATLEGYGITSVIANVSRIDWLRNAAGLLDTNYWKGKLRPRPVLDWYLKRVDDAVRHTKEFFPGKTLSLIGHSAGGWLARVYMEEFGTSDISLLLTLGTPHTPPPKGVSGVVDQTRGLLDYVQNHCAKAVYTPDLKYVCIAGRYILGARIFNDSSQVTDDIGSANNEQEVVGITSAAERTVSTSTFQARFVGQGYKQVCGRADVWGDGVVPEEWAYLEGAVNIGIDGIYHSPVGSDDVLRPWYGSPAVVEQWIDHLLR